MLEYGYKSSTRSPVLAENKAAAPKEKEIVREKEVIVKIRCQYCHNLFDETFDRCPHCNAKR
jgi:hypothetical protein